MPLLSAIIIGFCPPTTPAPGAGDTRGEFKFPELIIKIGLEVVAVVVMQPMADELTPPPDTTLLITEGPLDE